MCALGGRPKENGGHKRVNLSLSKMTLEILEELKKKYAHDKNKSQIIEECIKVASEYMELTSDREFQQFMLESLIDILKKFGKYKEV